MSAVPARRRPAKREEADDAEVGPWPRDVSREPEMKISEVVDRLKTEFPALSLSKVRYLEGEGLISPYRVGNGYRRYSKADVERLRYALTAQRDEYLPLSVIRQRLAELDASPQAPEPAPIPRVVAAGGHAVIGTSLDAESLAHHAGASMAQLEELVVIGVVAPDAHGRFDARALGTVSLALRAHRLDVRAVELGEVGGVEARRQEGRLLRGLGRLVDRHLQGGLLDGCGHRRLLSEKLTS